MMLIELRVLTGMGVKDATAQKYLGRLNEVLPEHAIDTPLRVAHFLAQVVMESARFQAVEENLNYSAERLLQVFKTHFTAAQAQQYAHNPEKIGNRVYADRLGNGNEASGDGYRYRGRGLIQLTGKYNYGELRKFLAKQEPSKPDVVATPDLVASTYAVDSAVFFWTMRNINAKADNDDINAVTKAVNGSTRGVDARRALLDKAKALLAVDVPKLDPVTDFVSAQTLNLRATAGTSGAVLGKLSSETPVQRLAGVTPVTADGFTWVQLRAVPGIEVVTGWVADEYLTAAPTLENPTHMVAVSSVLRMRRGPTTASEVVAELANGTEVEVGPDPPVAADGFRWVATKAVQSGVLVTGFVADEFLVAK